MTNMAHELMWMKRGLAETCYVFFKSLANPTRLAILETLEDAPRNVNDIAEKLKQEQSMISHNLRALEKCGFVFSERKKKQRFYSLNKETMEPLLKTFKHHSEKYCPTGGKCLTAKGLREKRKKDASRQLSVTHE